MRHRMAAAALALLGLLLSTYLLLHRFGLVGALACTGGDSCDRVQLGRYGEFLGVPVAAYGVGGYLTLLVVALAGLQPGRVERRGPTVALAAFSGLGVAFTLYLKYLELFRIHAVCPWCLVSAAIIVAIFGVSLAGLRQHRDG